MAPDGGATVNKILAEKHYNRQAKHQNTRVRTTNVTVTAHFIYDLGVLPSSAHTVSMEMYQDALHEGNNKRASVRGINFACQKQYVQQL